MPWGEAALRKAKKEDKLILVSIGYSSCHWCHVMEKESFEDEETAALMNEHFVCIKVDREERPDIDQLYLTAVQLMTRQGGWPLNCFALPDGRPVYGGTYFPRETWKNVLNRLAELYKNQKEELKVYAQQLADGIQQTESLKLSTPGNAPDDTDLHQSVHRWISNFDREEGGAGRVPKFPMPNNYQFLLRYGIITGNQDVVKHVHHTLRKIAMGGIFDQAGGGFARYSTDRYWKVPHFEKMLYDNAQLITLYAEAWQHNRGEMYKQVCFRTIDFLNREMRAGQGYYYSALDADSEGEEGKFYVWTKKELQQRLSPELFELCIKVYDFGEAGEWEDGNYILLRTRNDAELIQDLGLSSTKELYNLINRLNQAILAIRDARIRPGLDDKLLVSWNGLMIRALADTYRSFGRDEDLDKARTLAGFILKNCRDEAGRLIHSWKNGRSTSTGFIEDYAFLTDGLIALYQACFEEKWLIEAEKLCATALEDFGSPEGLFWFSSKSQAELVTRQTELADNVIPSSNSQMALNLFRLGIYFSRPEWIEKAHAMSGFVRSDLIEYGSAYSNWGMLALMQAFPSAELAVTGPGAMEAIKELSSKYGFRILCSASERDSPLPFLAGRHGNKLQFFVCRKQSCLMPVNSLSEAIAQLNQIFKPS